MLKDYLSKLFATAMLLFCLGSAYAQNLTVTAPAGIAGDYPVRPSVFGIDFTSISGDLILADDGDDMGGTTSVNDGCEPLVNDVSGKIALIDRNNCGFVQKAINAQDGGAIGVIICNSDVDNPDNVIYMGGDDMGALTIPVAMMSYNNCLTIKAELGTGVSGEFAVASEGESCATAYPAMEGLNTAPALTGGGALLNDAVSGLFYTFTPAMDAKMTVSSCEGGSDTRLYVLTDGCDVLTTVGTNDDACLVVPGGMDAYASYLEVIVYAGQEYVIYWDDTWDASGFDWTLTLEELPMVDIEATVDLNDVGPAPEGGYIAGEFNMWTPEPMTDNGDGTYTFTFQAQAGYMTTYKFLNGPGGWETGADLMDCGMDDGSGNINRVAFPGLDGVSTPAYCYDSCNPCPPDVACPNWVEDDFESYALGTIGDQVAGDAWTTWSNDPGGAEDGLVSTDFSASGSQSLNISAAGGDDVIMDVGLRTEGNFILKWRMYVPDGFGAYYNLQKTTANLPSPGTEDFMIQVDMTPDGNVAMDAGGENAFTFTYPHDTWFNVYHIIDLDNGIGRLMIDGVEVANWEASWDIFNQTPDGAVSIGGVDFFGNTDNNYYVDDVLFKQIDPCPAGALICDGFDGYDLGELGPQAPWWDTWTFNPGGADDAVVVNTQQVSCEQSMEISEAGGDDVLLLLGDRNGGNYNLSWNMHVPSGSSGYFNTQKFQDNPGGEFGIEVFMDDGGTGTINAGGTGTATFTYPQDEWFSVNISFDLDNDVLVLTVAGTDVLTFTTSGTANGAAITNQIGAIDFFGNAGNLYYVDDILFTGEAPPPTEYISVTFGVDMTDYLAFGGTLETIKIAGQFGTLGATDENGEALIDWDPPTSPEFTNQGDDVWTTTILFPDSSWNKELKFKFLNTPDTWGSDCGVQQECLDDVDADCKATDSDDRLEVLPSEDGDICYTWNTCYGCNEEVSTEETFELPMTIAPNPFSQETIVTFANSLDNADARLATLTGQVARTYKVNGTQLIINKEDLTPGVYFFTVVTAEGVSQAEKLIVQ